MSSFFCLSSQHSNDPVVEYRRSSLYDSVFTYNTERQFCNKYSSSVHESMHRDLIEEDSPTIWRMFEVLFMVFSSVLIIFTLPFSLFFTIKFVSPHERLIVMRFGKAQKVRGAGTAFVFPFVDQATRIDIRIKSFELTFQVITVDRGLAEINVVVLSKVSDPLVYFCSVQNREETMRSLSYNIVYNNLMKKMMSDLTSPESLAQILAKSQDEFNKYCENMGIEVTQVSAIQFKIVKEGENQTLSLFNTLMKSDLGTQLMSQFGPQIKSYMADSLNNQSISTVCIDKPIVEKPIIVIDNNSIPHDPDVERLIVRVRSVCDAQLVAKVGKIYRIRCANGVGVTPFEIDLNLRDGEGSCDWRNFVTSPPIADVVFSLQKETLFALVNNTVSPLSAYLNGSVAICGNVTDAFNLKHLVERAKQIK